MPGYFESRPALRPLARRDYRLLLAGSVLVGILTPFHLMTQVFWVNHDFPERAVVYSGVLAASRGAAMVLFSLAGGAIADRVERRRVLLVCESLSLGAHAVIAGLMIAQPFGEATVAAVAAWTFLAAGVQSIDSPARSASIPAAAGRENVGAAIALMSVAGQLTMPLSLPLVGLLNGAMPSGVVYAGSLLAWLGILPLIAMLRFQSRGGATAVSMVANIRAGLSYARGRRPILATLAIVAVVQVLGMPIATPLGPMFEIEVLGFTAAQVGLMGATWGLGSLTASVGLARMRGLTLRGSTLVAVSTLFGVAALGFGYSRFIPLTAVSDYGMGFAFTGTMLVASTLVQHMVDDSVRGRVLSLFPFTLGLAQVGTAVAGLVGQRTGLDVLLPALGWAELAGCAVLILVFRELVGARARPAAAVAAVPPAA
ncbi:MAG: MFS transporter [Chloroflexi bacterium]|nr:MFS transporter [Chloroflexota bacterium]